ncbi:type II secretion system protein [bacterium]|nr:type II secretion system protein [bacterium]
MLISYVKNLRNRRSLLLPLRGFTLAEVLITLGIIGVVAAMTIPTLMQKLDEREKVSGLKKIYSTMSNAYSMAIANNGGSSDFGYNTTSGWYQDDDGNSIDATSRDNADIMFNAFKPYLKIAKECEHGQSGCFTENLKAYSGDFSWGNLATIQGGVRKFALLQDGASVGFLSPQDNYSHGVLYVDVNGLKGPNKAGVDVFQFITSTDSNKILLPESDFTGETTCYSDNLICGAWVLLNNNEDYLHCDDLSWNGKTKCD